MLLGMGTRKFNWITNPMVLGMGTRKFNWISTPMLLGTRSYFREDLDKGHLPIHPLLPRVPQLDT